MVMRIPLTRYGLPQVVLFPAVLLTGMVIYFFIVYCFFQPVCACFLCTVLIWLPELILFILLIWVFSFFRNPHRQIVQDANLLLAPADGTIVSIETLQNYNVFERPVLRVEIFLNIFNVHINRVPCPVKIGQIIYKPGKFINARNPQSNRVNEANEVEMYRLDEPRDRLMVRQISGAIARRIVCQAKTGKEYIAGAQFGMIKFGSGTELYIPVRKNLKCCVQKGDKVKAGLTVLAKYE